MNIFLIIRLAQVVLGKCSYHVLVILIDVSCLYAKSLSLSQNNSRPLCSFSRTSFTTFTTSGGNVHVHTRTVIDDDGSVRREMRFKTPAAASGDATSSVPEPDTTTRMRNGEFLKHFEIFSLKMIVL